MRKQLLEELSMEEEEYRFYIEALPLAEWKDHIIEAVTYCTMIGQFTTARAYLEILPIIVMAEKEMNRNAGEAEESVRREGPHFLK